jgi:thiamine-phosphate pyrophosphorylase
MKKKAIQSGVYLVVDPAANRHTLTIKLRQAVKGKIVAVQILDNFNPRQNSAQLIAEITSLCAPENIPVLINNRWELLPDTGLDGVHFDCVPDDFERIRQRWGEEKIVGITCGNDLSVVRWADQNGLDYISFCSVFPSPTANSCERITFDTIREARKITSLPIFLAGGIKPDNMHLLNGLNYSGVAVVSGVMNADNPLDELRRYNEKLIQAG